MLPPTDTSVAVASDENTTNCHVFFFFHPCIVRISLIYFFFLQVANSNPPAGTAANGSSAYQPNPQTGSGNQVQAGDAFHRQQPPPPRRSSSLLPMLRRRATEPLPQSHRERYAQRPGETHTRYTYGFSQKERRSGYIFGFSQREAEYTNDDAQNVPYRVATGYEPGFVCHSQTLSSFNTPAEGNLNRGSYDYGYARGRTPAPMHGPAALDNAPSQAFCDAQGNAHGHKFRPARSRTLDAIHRQDGRQSPSYTDNIRAMAGQMYGDPPTRSRLPARTERNGNTHRSVDRYVDAHSHNYEHNRALTRNHHLRLSGGL